ncbi:MAG: hypothetical protein JNM07_00870 [Phycisphaerae bacterium]|nr:hypothetical protein [Phycisphaerae bacterium]
MKRIGVKGLLALGAVLLAVNLVVAFTSRAGAQPSVQPGPRGRCVGLASDGNRVYRAFEDGTVEAIWPRADVATKDYSKGAGKWIDVTSLKTVN